MVQCTTFKNMFVKNACNLGHSNMHCTYTCINIVTESIIGAPKMQNKFGNIPKFNIFSMFNVTFNFAPYNFFALNLLCFKFGIIFQLLFLIALRVDG